MQDILLAGDKHGSVQDDGAGQGLTTGAVVPSEPPARKSGQRRMRPRTTCHRRCVVTTMVRCAGRETGEWSRCLFAFGSERNGL